MYHDTDHCQDNEIEQDIILRSKQVIFSITSVAQW